MAFRDWAPDIAPRHACRGATSPRSRAQETSVTPNSAPAQKLYAHTVFCGDSRRRRPWAGGPPGQGRTVTPWAGISRADVSSLHLNAMSLHRAGDPRRFPATVHPPRRAAVAPRTAAGTTAEVAGVTVGAAGITVEVAGITAEVAGITVEVTGITAARARALRASPGVSGRRPAWAGAADALRATPRNTWPRPEYPGVLRGTPGGRERLRATPGSGGVGGGGRRRR